MQQPTDRDRVIAILGGLALFLSLIENVIPKPVPFVRIGLANLPILISLIILTPKETIYLILIKSIGSSLVTGTIFSWLALYSLGGSLAAGFAMLIIYRLLGESVTMIGVSVVGALCNNLIQISMAMLFLGTGARYLGIPILITGFFSGILLGITANRFITKSKWVEEERRG